MNKISCGLDTETTGLPSHNLDANNPKQARVIQLALKLITESGRVICQFSTLIKPSGWDEIHPKAFEAHGITREDCERFGIEAEKAFMVFLYYASLADEFVAHNAPFDKKMMLIESDATGNDFPDTPWFDTMPPATDICKVPPTPAMQRAGRTHYKSANLTEALDIMCGKTLEGAHDAMVDVSACLDLLLEIRKKNGKEDI